MTFHSVVPQTRLLATTIDLVVRSSRWPVVFSAVSRRVAREVEPLARDRMVKYLPNGVDRSFWAPTTPRPRMSERLEVISVMRLNRKKRPLALVGLMRRLVRLLPPRASARLRIAGDGPERRHLEHAIARRGLSDHVELLGRRTRGELRDLFGSGDVFVLPTVRESFGIAALEARCSGLPVVAMAGSGVSELIAHDREGLLAKSDAELASHVASLARDPARWSAIAEHNRATPPPCDWSAVLPAHLEIYSEAIALRASRVRSA